MGLKQGLEMAMGRLWVGFGKPIPYTLEIYNTHICKSPFAVPGRNACEIKMVHQEDAGLNVEMAKLAFAKGIWSYVCKMDDALRKYSTNNQLQLNSAVGAITSIQKVPSEFETLNGSTSTVHPDVSTRDICSSGNLESNSSRLSRMPSNKLMRNGLIVVGGALCLSRGHSSLGAKVAMAYILSKLTKRGSSSNQSRQGSLR